MHEIGVFSMALISSYKCPNSEYLELTLHASVTIIVAVDIGVAILNKEANNLYCSDSVANPPCQEISNVIAELKPNRLILMGVHGLDCGTTASVYSKLLLIK